MKFNCLLFVFARFKVTLLYGIIIISRQQQAVAVAVADIDSTHNCLLVSCENACE